MAVDLETAIQGFIETARRLQAEPALTAEAVLEHMIGLYRDVRIQGAALDAGNDMLLVQWGATYALAAGIPIDLRNVSDDELAFEQSQRRYFDVTRQVFAPGDDEEAEFDDLAIQMSMTLVYGPATSDEPSSHRWVDRPHRIEREIEQVRKVPFVQQLLGTEASRLVATVGHIG